MTALISPVIILFMAIIVGVVAYSIISAVFQSVNGIRSRV
jgi:general secretion pathway protein F/type IV pilus assembly protein PilC